jgi:RHS repeat-associated protein
MEITDMNEAEVVSYRYDPYGAVTITVGGTPQGSDPLGNPWMYTGRFLDEETGLYYYRARTYSPSMGRFLQRDPLGYGPGPSLYEYVLCRPTVETDARGTGDLPGSVRGGAGGEDGVGAGPGAARVGDGDALTRAESAAAAAEARAAAEASRRASEDAQRNLDVVVDMVMSSGPEWAIAAAEKYQASFACCQLGTRGRYRITGRCQWILHDYNWLQNLIGIDDYWTCRVLVDLERCLMQDGDDLRDIVGTVVHELRHAHQGPDEERDHGSDPDAGVTGDGRGEWAVADRRQAQETLDRTAAKQAK